MKTPSEIDIQQIDVAEEAARLFQRLQECGQDILYAEVAEKNTYFRVGATLLEKIVELQERSAAVKSVKEFTDTVLQIMEDELTADQRTRIMRRLKEIVDGAGPTR